MNPALLTKLKTVIREIAADESDPLLSDMEIIQQTEDLLTIGNQLDAVLTRQLHAMHTRSSTTIECGRETKGWLVEEQHRSGPEATRRMVVARALPERPEIAAALARGEINLEHAHVIVRLLRSTPPLIKDEVEKALVAAAEHVDPSALAAFCREIKDNLGWAEDKQEADQRRYDSRWLTLSDTIDRMTSVSGMLDPVAAAALKAALASMMARGGEEDTRTAQQRRADALTSLATQALNSGGLPEVNGERPHLNVTLAWTDLKAALEQQAQDSAREVAEAMRGGAILDGTEVSISTARMLACDAGIIPVVLGSNGEVLDLGRATRSWTKTQLRALLLETEGRCGWISRHARCQGPADHAHHIRWWSWNGATAITNGVYLCTFHHRLVHTSDWQIRKDPDGTIHTWRDPDASSHPPPRHRHT